MKIALIFKKSQIPGIFNQKALDRLAKLGEVVLHDSDDLSDEAIKKTIKDYGVDEADFLERLDDMVEQAFDDQCTGANPRYPLFSEIRQMYLNAYYGN